MKVLIFVTLIAFSVSQTPIAFFHGMGDACSNSGFDSFVQNVGKQTGAYAKCIEIGSGGTSSLLMNFQKQAEEACVNLLKDPVLNSSKAINVVGLSQGALIARYIAQKCGSIQVKTWVSIGGPNQGVSKVPRCSDGPFCDIINWFADKAIYSDMVQQNFGPAGYYRDLGQYDTYLAKSAFLPNFNNENPNSRDPEMKRRFASIERAVLWKFNQDTMVIPKESEWFGYYKDESKSEIINFDQTQLYTEDWIGFQQLHQAGKVEFIAVDGNHLQFKNEDTNLYLIPFLKD